MSSIPLLSRFLRKSPQSSTSQSSSDKPVVPPSSASSYVAETKTLPAAYRPTVSISKEAFPYYTQVSWPPNTKNLKPKPPSSPPTAVVQIVAAPPALPVPTVTHSNAFVAPNVKAQPPVVPMHPESLIPARQINFSPPPPHLIDIPIDSGPAFDDDIFRRKSDTNGSQNSNNPQNPKSLNQHPPRRTLEGNFSFPNKSPDHQAFTIPIGRHLSSGQYPPSPSTYSDSSSMYSYVSAPPELEYGYDDLHGVSSLRSYRLTRKDSTTLPQELIWHLFNGGPTSRENDDDRRSRHSSTGKRSIKSRSRRNSDGGASIRTARRSTKPNSRSDTFDSGRSRSKSRSTKSKHPRTSSASVSSSFVSIAPPTPSTVVTNGCRNSAFPSPREPMPAHALQAVQAAQAILGKETTTPILGVGSQSLDKPLGKPPAQREKRLPSYPGNADMDNIPHLNAPSAVDEPQMYPTSAEYLDSPSDEVTLASVLGGYNHPRTMKGSDQPHVYAISPKQSALSLRKEIPLPQMPHSTLSPQSDVSPPQPPAKTSSSRHNFRSKATQKQKQSQIQKSPPPNFVYPISHDDKLQSDSLYSETSNKLQSPSRLSTSSRPISGPSRPLPILPPAVPETPVAGSSKTINRLKVSSPRLSTADHKSWLTIDSDQTIKSINPRSLLFDEEFSGDLTHFKDDIPPSASTLKQDRQDGSPPPAEPPILHAEQIQEPEEKIMQVDPESKRTLKSGSEGTLQVVTISSSSTVQEQQRQPEQELPPDMASPPCTDTSPSSYSSAPLSSSNVTSIWSAEVQGVSRLEEGGGGGGDGLETTVRDQLPSPDERQTCGNGDALNSQELGRHDWETSEDSSEEHGKHSMALETKDNNSEVPRTIGVNVVSNVIPDIIEDLSLPESNGISEEKSDLQKDETPALIDQRHAEEEDKKGNSPLTENINGLNSASNLKDSDINILTNEFRKSIHNSSHVSIPWNSSTGSIGSQPLKSVYVDHNSSLSTSSFPHDDAKSVRRKQAFNVSHAPQDIHMDDQNSINISPSRPEHFPLPPSMSSVELSMPSEEHKDTNDFNRLADGRTSSPNEHRTRPFSPRESMRSSFSHKIEHKQNPSMGDVSLAASGFSISESHKVSSFANQRPASRTSSTFMNTAGPGNRSSALPIVEGVSSAPFPSQSKKAMLPIGNKIAIESIPATLSRQRSGSEPHPNVFQSRSQGRLSTIHQSPIQYNRPSALPLRHERPLGSMTFPETPYEYTPMATPKANNTSSPHVRGPSSTSNRQGKLSRLGSDVSLRRPAGPRPPRNVPNNPSNAKNNTSAKLTSPPNTARSFDLDPTSDGGTDFRPRPVEWRPYTLEAAQWTFTSEQLQEIVARAIRQSSVPSTVRLLTLDTLEEIRPEIERLEILQQDVTIRYCANVTRRRVILKSLRHHLMDADWTKRSQLTQELNDTSFLADQLTKDLFHTMYRLQQLYRLTDVHNGSALAMAVRKLNSSFVKQLDDMSQLGQYLAQTEAEKEEAWATAERLEREVMELKDKLEVMSNGTPDGSETASRRKPSVRASKASFRLSRSTRFSHASSTSSNYYPFSPAPPVPPIPRHAHAPNSRIWSLNTDVSAGMHSIQSAQSFGFSPTPEAFALEKAQMELYDILGLPRRVRKSVPSRTRPVSEILSPVTTSDGLSPHKSVEVSLRRNNSIPISPYIISENIRSR